LALPIADSFFLFRSPGDPNQFTFFEDVSDKLSTRADFLRDCVLAGLIDTLHTYGAFSTPGAFSRDLAERGVDALRRRDMRIRVWVNHGPAENVQCFGVPNIPHFLGDDPRSKFYHTDITLRYGIEYCWAGREFGEFIARDASCNVAALRAKSAAMFQGLRRRRHPIPRTRLLHPMVLRDGGRILGFARFWGTDGQTPVVSDIVRQLSVDNLRTLRETGSYAIVYQHFAVRRKEPGFGVGKYIANVEPYFEPDECAALTRLAQEYHDGNIFVTSTERLLTYNRMQRWLRWSTEEIGSRIGISLLGVKVPGMPERAVSRAEIDGLTFYSNRPHETDLFIRTDAGSIRVKDVVCNRKDHTDRESITVPVGSIEAADL
jgi:hypothetical protein